MVGCPLGLASDSDYEQLASKQILHYFTAKYSVSLYDIQL